MDYHFTEEQGLLRDAFAQFAKEEIAPHAAAWDAEDHVPMDIVPKLGEMGIMGVFVPEEYGGAGLGHIERCMALEEIARYWAGLAMMVFTHHLGVAAIVDYGTEEQKQKWLPGMCDGSCVCGLAVTEPGGGSDVAGLKTEAVLEDGTWTINGRKCFITNAQVADFFVVTAMTDKTQGTRGMSAFLVYKGTPGLSVGNHEDKMGIRTSITSDLLLEDVRIPVENRLGEEGTGFYTAMKTLDLARMWCAVIGVGVCQRCVDEAAVYAQQRVTFGKPIWKHQAIQFMLADMEIRTQASRALCANAITLADMGVPFTTEASAAKCFTGDSAVKNALDAIQIFGGYGYSREYPVEKLLRDAKIFQIFEGTNEVQRIVIARNTIGKFE